MKTLADSDDDDDNVLSWVKKSRKIEIEREKAEQRVGSLSASCCWQPQYIITSNGNKNTESLCLLNYINHYINNLNSR